LARAILRVALRPTTGTPLAAATGSAFFTTRPARSAAAAGRLLAIAGAFVTGPLVTFAARRAQLIGRDLSIAIRVEFLERLGRILNFRRGDDAIAIRIEYRDERRHGPAPFLASALRPPLWATLRAALTGRGLWLIARGSLRESGTGAKREREREEVFVSNHKWMWLWG
jgi:hypothetical protein